ncbi:MAG: hypothetical protein WD928_01885 [Gammaproteobacteria bacterium]
METNRIRLSVLLALLIGHQSVFAERDANSCAYAAADVAPRIKTVLGPRYGAAEDLEALSGSFRELEILLLEIGHCRAAAQSGEVPDAHRQEHVAEWHSLNQWLYRLANFVGLNARGDTSVSWRDEYALFAEIYEFEP